MVNTIRNIGIALSAASLLGAQFYDYPPNRSEHFTPRRGNSFAVETRKANPAGDEHGTTARAMRHGCRKLSESDVREIRRLSVARQVPCAELARRYGVTPTTIYRVAQHKKWASVKDVMQEFAP